MCLAPCFAGCTKEEYDVEVGRVLEALGSGGATLTGSLEREREAASEMLDFERAAALHKKLERIAGVLRELPELARRVEELTAVILQRAVEENAVAVFVVHAGIIADPFLLRFAELSSQPRSVETILRQQLGTALEPAGSPLSQTLGDNLSLLARWFYSKPREGEIFFPSPDWPYRRIIRACSRLLAPPAEPAPPG